MASGHPPYLMPAGILSGETAARAVAGGEALPLAGGSLAFSCCEVLTRRSGGGADGLVIPTGVLSAWAEAQGPATAAHVAGLLARLSAPRPPFAGLSLDRPLVMGVINATPDSFSDGGEFLDAERALAHGVALLEAGADILDVGGESTRPGAEPVPAEEELRRVLPVVGGLAERGARVSIDTRHAAVMAAAVAAGATIVNDVTGLTGDPAALRTVAATRAAVVLMHMRGEPRTMQEAPVYSYAPLDVFDWLAGRIAACAAAGIGHSRICLDPGIGFGKTVEHNAAILARAGLLHGLGCAVLIGASRKSMIARLSAGEPPRGRLPGSLAVALGVLSQGAQIVRVHDVAETVQAIRVWQATHC